MVFLRTHLNYSALCCALKYWHKRKKVFMCLLLCMCVVLDALLHGGLLLALFPQSKHLHAGTLYHLEDSTVTHHPPAALKNGCWNYVVWMRRRQG